jgi:hypothetical protein
MEMDELQTKIMKIADQESFLVSGNREGNEMISSLSMLKMIEDFN